MLPETGGYGLQERMTKLGSLSDHDIYLMTTAKKKKDCKIRSSQIMTHFIQPSQLMTLIAELNYGRNSRTTYIPFAGKVVAGVTRATLSRLCIPKNKTSRENRR